MNPPRSDTGAVRGRPCPALAIDLASRRALLAGLEALAAADLGGSLTIRSRGVGQGATFTLYLPFQLPES